MSTVTIAGIPVDLDAEGFMTDPTAWTREIAEQLANHE